MVLRFEAHPDNPQPRLIKQAADMLRQGAILAIPTDSSYALVCHLDDRPAVERLRRIRQINDKHHLTLLCRDLSELSSYARVDNRQYRLLKLATPGPYTFILEASKEVPKRLSHPSRKTDRKSTRLNSSHLVISYAVFCLKKKKQRTTTHLWRPVTRSRKAATTASTATLQVIFSMHQPKTHSVSADLNSRTRVVTGSVRVA